MVTIIFLGVCIAGEALLVYCMFHFVQEAIGIWRSNKTKTAQFLRNQEMSQSQLISPLSSAVWAEGRWQLKIADHSQASARQFVSPQAKR